MKYAKGKRNGAAERIRTAGLLITNQLLYHLSYGGLKSFLSGKQKHLAKCEGIYQNVFQKNDLLTINFIHMCQD